MKNQKTGLRKIFVNEDTGERGEFELVLRDRKCTKQDVDFNQSLSPSMRKRKRAIECETEFHWRRVDKQYE